MPKLPIHDRYERDRIRKIHRQRQSCAKNSPRFPAVASPFSPLVKAGGGEERNVTRHSVRSSSRSSDCTRSIPVPIGPVQCSRSSHWPPSCGSWWPTRGCPLCGHLGHSGVVEADSDHETMGDTISRARPSQPRWNTFKHSCKRDRNPCDRPPPTGAAAQHRRRKSLSLWFLAGSYPKSPQLF